MSKISIAEAKQLVWDEMLTILDDDYPDKLDSLHAELVMDERFTEDEADEIIENYWRDVSPC